MIKPQLPIYKTLDEKRNLIKTSGISKRRDRNSYTRQETQVLNSWFLGHLQHPYPSLEDKIILAGSNLSYNDVDNWYIYFILTVG